MIQVRKAADRGWFDHGWLKTHHTFSFGEYHDPRFMGFRTLRVINEDWVAPGAGFPTHSHRDMEIITYLLEGRLEHKDSMGNTSVIRPGEVQRMSAGSGVTHSEFNASKSERVHLLQIWIFPDRKGLTPGYEQKAFDPAGADGRVRPIATADGRDGSVRLHQQASIYDCRLRQAQSAEFRPAPARGVWVQVTDGTVEVNDHALNAGDGASIEGETLLRLSSGPGGGALVFELA